MERGEQVARDDLQVELREPGARQVEQQTGTDDRVDELRLTASKEKRTYMVRTTAEWVWDTMAMMKLRRREVASSSPDRGTTVGQIFSPTGTVFSSECGGFLKF